MLTFGSLFAGIGGFDLGFERAGMRCLWQVEIDSYCNKVLERHWPDVRRLRDIRDCGAHNLAAVDVVCGGFPCQPFSLSGNRRGKSDDRYLWPEMLRVVAELRPSWVVAENVFGFISLGLDDALADLEAEGYEAWPIVIPACAVGALHRRDRVFVVALNSNRKRQGTEHEVRQKDAESNGVCETVSDAVGRRCEPDLAEERSVRESHAGNHVADTDGAGWKSENRRGVVHDTRGYCASQVWKTHSALGAVQDWWGIEPGMGRVVDGLSTRLDRFRRRKRLEGLGNALVPQVAQVIGHFLVQADARYRQNDADVL